MSMEPDLVLLSTFSEMAKDIASARSVAETVEQVMRHVGRAFAPVNWSLLLRNDRTGELRFVHVTGEGAAGIRGLVLERGQKYRRLARGYALGSGNSIPDYTPVEGYLAMIRAAQAIRELER